MIIPLPHYDNFGFFFFFFFFLKSGGRGGGEENVSESPPPPPPPPVTLYTCRQNYLAFQEGNMIAVVSAIMFWSACEHYQKLIDMPIMKTPQ